MHYLFSELKLHVLQHSAEEKAVTYLEGTAPAQVPQLTTESTCMQPHNECPVLLILVFS